MTPWGDVGSEAAVTPQAEDNMFRSTHTAHECRGGLGCAFGKPTPPNPGQPRFPSLALSRLLNARRPALLTLQDTIIEYFDGGSSFGLKDILTVKNERRVINFYHT